MVKVHIWLRDEQHVGHAALSIKNTYVSFWPDGTATKKDLKIKRSHPGTYMTSLLDDIQNESGRAPITIEIDRLDEDKMLNCIEQLRIKIPRYQIARNNCSHIIVRVLVAGANKTPSFMPHAGEYAKIGRIVGYGVWTPANVMRYANELRNS
ncbi:hypothetical protein VT06_06645 [Arsukibacterium sp. MJ3]|jgi:hypothetical protein|uniref:hypothetical protein n=1 Tax=Arsukibacterium sp. MJ3 TaxID=1632859 RepID=UPI0006272FB3|nr:hypothetical protein [Arsukibacterium sp. MJ3]KKO49503.1 hypothetical protein VT06_06645 [Arsukibacterium sp. MJ3]